MIPFRNALFAALFFIIQNGFQMNWIFNAFDLLDQIHQKVEFHDSLSYFSKKTFTASAASDSNLTT